MRFCSFAAVALALVFPALAASHDEPAVTSVVRADPRTGRLVRRIVVPQTVVQPRVVRPREVSSRTPSSQPVVSAAGVHQIVEEVSRQYGVDPLMVHSIIHVESSYNRFALSPKGAEGLMQLIPSTARRFGVRNSFDSRQNIEGGVRYLRHLLDRFDDLRHVFAAYNAGEDAVIRFRGIPPYAETQQYVYRVGKRYGELRRAQRRVEQAAVRTPPVPAAEFRPLEAFVDLEGKLHLRTR